MIQRLAQCSELIRADVIDAGFACVHREHVSVHEIVRVDELEFLVAVADDVNLPVLLNPLEQNLEDAESSDAENGARADDDERDVPSGADVAHGEFAREFGATVNLHRRHRRIIRDRATFWRAKDGARTHVDESLHARLHRLLGSDARAFYVHRPEISTCLGERHKCDVVVNDINALHGTRYAVGITDVAFDELDFLRARRIFPDVEDADAFAAFVQTPRDEIAKKARAAGDEMFHFENNSKRQ